MGTSKITVISAVYFIIGLYTFGFNSIDNFHVSSSQAVAISVQSEHLAQTGVSLALVAMGNNPAISSMSPRSLSTLGGKVTYGVSNPVTVDPSERLITSTAIINSTQIISSTVVTFNKGRWRVVRTYSQSIS